MRIPFFVFEQSWHESVSGSELLFGDLIYLLHHSKNHRGGIAHSRWPEQICLEIHADI